MQFMLMLVAGTLVPPLPELLQIGLQQPELRLFWDRLAWGDPYWKLPLGSLADSPSQTTP